MRCVPLTATLCMPLLCAYRVHLAINYVNNEGETRRFTCGTAVYSDCFEHGIFFSPAPFPKVSHHQHARWVILCPKSPNEISRRRLHAFVAADSASLESCGVCP